MSATILIVEDEATLAEVLTDNLLAEGFSVEVAPDGAKGMELWRAKRPNLVVLDVMLPRTSGFDLCRAMRQRGDETPVLFLSAKGRPEDRVAGLAAGGDDYLAKPFHLPEFLLRVKAMLRRQNWQAEDKEATRYRFGGNVVDFRSWTATLADGTVEPLGEREVRILKVLIDRAGEVVSRDDILDEAWGDAVFPSSRTVDNFVMRLRKLFEPDPTKPVHIVTVWGVGYRFDPHGGEVKGDRA